MGEGGEGAESAANCEAQLVPNRTSVQHNKSELARRLARGGSWKESKGSRGLGLGVGGTELTHSSFMSGDEFKSWLGSQESASLPARPPAGLCRPPRPAGAGAGAAGLVSGVQDGSGACRWCGRGATVPGDACHPCSCSFSHPPSRSACTSRPWRSEPHARPWPRSGGSPAEPGRPTPWQRGLA